MYSVCRLLLYSLVHRDMPTFFVVLDGCGEVVDFLKLNHFLKRKNSYWESEKLDKVYIFSALCKILYRKYTVDTDA